MQPTAKSKPGRTVLPAAPDGPPPIHPGDILKDEIDALRFSLSAFAAALHIGKARISGCGCKPTTI